jgi:hypothetical protein
VVRRCGSRISVRFDGNGAASFQFLVSDQIGARGGGEGRCRLDQPRCSLEIRAGDRVTDVETVFVDEVPPPGRLVVEPRTGLRVGDTVSVTAIGLAPGSAISVTVCALPARTSRCGEPGPVMALTVGTDGTATDDLVLAVTEVGTDRVACGRRATCQLVVSSDDIGVRAPPVRLSFAGAPGADYEPARVLGGVLVAIVLLAAAWWLVRSTDWRPPPEADGSPIDDAAFADLDLEAELFDDREVARSP